MFYNLEDFWFVIPGLVVPSLSAIAELAVSVMVFTDVAPEYPGSLVVAEPAVSEPAPAVLAVAEPVASVPEPLVSAAAPVDFGA